MQYDTTQGPQDSLGGKAFRYQYNCRTLSYMEMACHSHHLESTKLIGSPDNVSNGVGAEGSLRLPP
jgi:hypothetical protein